MSVADRFTPPSSAEIVTAVEDFTLLVEIGKLALVAPAGTVTVPGTVATAGLLLDSATTTPPVGADALRTTVPVAALPPRTLVGFSPSAESIGVGVIVSCAVRLTPPALAEIAAVVETAT